jgi:predicted ATPase
MPFSVPESEVYIMITELRAQNFKSWKDTGKLQIAPLTGFFGANSSGKTSILQTLLMLKQTVERPPDWDGVIDFGDYSSLVNLGSFDDLIHQHKRDMPLQISLSWKFSEKLSIERVDGIDGIDTLTFELSVFDNENSVPTGSFGYQVGRQSYVVDWNSQDVQLITFPVKLKHHDESLFRCYGIRSAHYHNQEIFSSLQIRFENLFHSIRYLGPLREYPRRHYAWQGKHSPGVGQHGEDMVTALFSGRIQLRSLEEHIPKWLQQLDLIDSYRLNPISETEKDYEFLVRKYKGGPEVRLTDVGFGVSQVLPVLILCYYVPEGSILILEQPEAHLHPKVQAELADLLIEVVKNRRLQIILESHSEHLLIRLMRRIAEEQISADDTAFYFCEMNEGVSEIERLDVDDYGNITNWPQNFFGDEMGDLAAKTKAEMKRRKADKL